MTSPGVSGKLDRPGGALYHLADLLLAPDQSPFVPLAVMEEIHARIPASDLQVFPGARHGLPCSHGEACGRVLRAFLDRRG